MSELDGRVAFQFAVERADVPTSLAQRLRLPIGSGRSIRDPRDLERFDAAPPWVPAVDHAQVPRHRPLVGIHRQREDVGRRPKRDHPRRGREHRQRRRDDTRLGRRRRFGRGDRRRGWGWLDLDLAKVVLAAVVARGNRDPQNRVVVGVGLLTRRQRLDQYLVFRRDHRVGRVDRQAPPGPGRVEPIDPTLRLHLVNVVRPRTQPRKRVPTVGIGNDPDRSVGISPRQGAVAAERLTQHGSQLQRHARDPLVFVAEHPVPVFAKRFRVGRRLHDERRAVLEHHAGDHRRRDLGEVVPAGAPSAAEIDPHDQVVVGHAAPRRPDNLPAVKQPVGLPLADAVFARRQTGEPIPPRRVGSRRRDHVPPRIDQLDLDARKRSFPVFETPVQVRIDPSPTRDLGRQPFVKVVILELRTDEQLDTHSVPSDHLAAPAAEFLSPLQIARRLVLEDLVPTGTEPSEPVVPRTVSPCLGHQPSVVVVQLDQHARNRIRRALGVRRVAFDINGTAELGRLVFTEVVVDARLTRQQPDRADPARPLRDAPDRTWLRAPGEITRGGLFNDRVTSRRQVFKPVTSLGVGRRPRDLTTRFVEQPNRDALQQRFAGVPYAIAVAVRVHPARQAPGEQLAEVVIDPLAPLF